MPRGNTPEQRKQRNITSEKWDAENTARYTLTLTISKDADIIAKLDSVPSKAGYIKDLIRRDLRAKGLLK